MVETFGISLAPSGRPFVDPTAPDALAIDPKAAKRIREAFEHDPRHALLELGASELRVLVPASVGWFREVGRRFVAALCAVPDLEELRERASVVPHDDDLRALIASAPPLRGGEYLSLDVARALFSDLEAAYREQIKAYAGTVQAWLHEKNPIWNRVGRVVLNLAENRNDPEHPFAFIATYTAHLSARGTVVHVALGRAFEESAGKKDRQRLLALLEPLERASAHSALVKELIESGEIFHPLAWTTAEAYGFLQQVPALEAAGVIVRVPDWWSARRRPVVTVTVGDKAPGGLGAEALLDFDVRVTLDGEPLARADLAVLERATNGLALIRGRWVEVDRERLDQALGRWNEAQRAAEDGLAFHEAMRLLAGAEIAGTDSPIEATDPDWVAVRPGAWLEKTLARLRTPEAIALAKPGKDLHATLRPYQEVGVRWLWMLHELGLGGCLADDMGLGKTIQVIALLLLRKRAAATSPALLVVPASLLANWQSEIERFAPSLRPLVAHPSVLSADELTSLSNGEIAADVVLTSYGFLLRWDWIKAKTWGLVVLDEAQAIKNPGAKSTRVAKALRSRFRLALTGTPIENRLGDLWSIFDFTSPGLLGSAKAFRTFSKKLDKEHNYAPLRELVRPYVLRRLKTDRSVISDLPEKTEMVAWCSLTKQQAALYQKAVDDLARELKKSEGIKRRGIVLATLTRLKQICNHPSQWLRDGAWDAEASGKFARLRELVEPIVERQEKTLVFTQFREPTDPLNHYLSELFGRRGLVLHGETPVARRRELVEAFQKEDGPPFFVLSLKAGGYGLNLTEAQHVIHFDRWWNPAVENQATDRAFRIGQKKNVVVHKFVCRGTIEERIDKLLAKKRELSDQILEGGAEVALTELPDDELLRLVTLDLNRALSMS